MTKKNVSLLKRSRQNKQTQNTQLIIDREEMITSKETLAFKSAQRALENLSLLVEQNKITYRRSQVILARANKIYESERHSGNAYGE
jgi:hypothetical protein